MWRDFLSKILKLYTRVGAFVNANCNDKILKFKTCQKGTAVVENALVAAFVVGGVLSGSSYMSHEAEDGENALLGVFKTASASSSSGENVASSNNAKSDGVMITE